MHLSTSRYVYEPGNWVDVDLRVQNSDPALDVVVQGDIVDGNGDVVSGLLLRSLHDLGGPIVFEPTWDSTDTPTGDYRIVVSLIDGEGAVLDSAEIGFRLGMVQGEVTALTVDPTTLNAGPTFDISLVFRNSGTVPITGTATIGIYPVGTVTPTAQMTRTLDNVQPGTTATFATEWDATGLPSQDYRVTGLVKYDGRATPPLVVDLNASFRNYLNIRITF